jgi:fructan beta-fructosidase
MPTRLSRHFAFAAALLLAGSSAPAAALYCEPYRPQYHFTPEKNWMNDPNGMVFYAGEYHLFYQFNPFGDKWGHMSWGHAISSDLVHWEHLPLALPEKEGIMAFSGSAVVDWRNTTGWGQAGEPPLVAIYTGHQSELKHQSQYIAYSVDHGRTWKTYEGNPVLDRGLADFRDPKVMWFAEADCWVMTVALPTEHKVAFYRSADLKSWQLLSEFGPAGATGGLWECPDLFPLERPDGGRCWVLIVSVGDGAVNGGSGCQYFIGEFDGRKFTPDSTEVRWLDFGRDFYAAVTWSDVPPTDARRLCLGWMNNWKYAQEIPTTSWRSAQSIIRELALVRDGDQLKLVQRPAAEYLRLRGKPWCLTQATVLAGELPLDQAPFATGSWEFKAVLAPKGRAEAGLVLQAGLHRAVIGYDAKRQVLFVDRSDSGESFHPNFGGRHEAPLVLTEGVLHLHVFFDQSTLEVFAEGGRLAISDQLFFPAGQPPQVRLFARDGDIADLSVQAWPLRSIWRSEHSPSK